MPAEVPGPTTPTFFTSRVAKTDYPVIDTDPHFKRVIRYARTADYVYGGLAALLGPGLLGAMQVLNPVRTNKHTLMKGFRLASAIGVCGGFLIYYKRAALRFYGATENAREIEMDMREMVDKVKKGEPIYGNSRLSPHMQAVAARQSRYSVLMFSVLPWFNFVNHNHHGVDTAKYYQQAERELENERLGGLTANSAGQDNA